MADFKNRSSWTDKFTAELEGKLNGKAQALLGYLGDPPDLDAVPQSFWDGISTELKPVLMQTLTDIYLESGKEFVANAAIDVQWHLVNKAAAEWAKRHTDKLVSDLYQTNIDGTGALVDSFYSDQWTLGDLEDRLGKLFGVDRAKVIAPTEITRASVEGERGVVSQIEDETGWKLPEVWRTSEDEKVCPICGGHDGHEEGDGWTGAVDGPPAHPECLCWTVHELPNLKNLTPTFSETAREGRTEEE